MLSNLESCEIQLFQFLTMTKQLYLNTVMLGHGHINAFAQGKYGNIAKLKTIYC